MDRGRMYVLHRTIATRIRQITITTTLMENVTIYGISSYWPENSVLFLIYYHIVRSFVVLLFCDRDDDGSISLFLEQSALGPLRLYKPSSNPTLEPSIHQSSEININTINTLATKPLYIPNQRSTKQTT